MEQPPVVVIPDAKTLDGVNIHLGFMAKTLERLEAGQTATNTKIDEMKEVFTPLAVFNDLKLDHETRIRANTRDIQITQTQLKTYGTLIGIVLGGLEIILHYWKG